MDWSAERADATALVMAGDDADVRLRTPERSETATNVHVLAPGPDFGRGRGKENENVWVRASGVQMQTADLVGVVAGVDAAGVEVPNGNGNASVWDLQGDWRMQSS